MMLQKTLKISSNPKTSFESASVILQKFSVVLFCLTFPLYPKGWD